MVASVWQLLFVLLISFIFNLLFCILVLYISVTEGGGRSQHKVCKYSFGLVDLPAVKFFNERHLSVQTLRTRTEADILGAAPSDPPVRLCPPAAKDLRVTKEPPASTPFALCHISPIVILVMINSPSLLNNW